MKIFCQMVVLGMKARFCGRKPDFLDGMKAEFWWHDNQNFVCGMEAGFWHESQFLWRESQVLVLWHECQNFVAWEPDFVCGMGAEFLKTKFCLSACKPDFLFLA